MPKKVGVLTGGGDCPGLNAVIRAVTRRSLVRGHTIVGIREGWRGLVDGHFMELGPREISGILPRGGTILGTTRTNPYKTDGGVEQVLENFRAQSLDALVAIGGEDTLGVASRLFAEHGLPVVGVPKTIDNDLMLTDCSPGFGSAAKYLATSMREAGMDVRSMAGGRRVFILEAMGRHTGWLAGACALAAEGPGEPPHIVLMPEVPFDLERFLSEVESCLAHYNCCTIAVAEGLVDQEGRAIAEQRSATVYGHEQLGGIGGWLAQRIRERTGVTCHAAVADYLQRAGRHLASAMDVAQAYAAGAEAVRLALARTTDVMTTIERLQDEPYRWQIGTAPLGDIGDREKPVPREFIREDGLHVTEAFLRYLRPLIAGEAPPAFRDGLPDYRLIPWPAVPKRLPAFG